MKIIDATHLVIDLPPRWLIAIDVSTPVEPGPELAAKESVIGERLGIVCDWILETTPLYTSAEDARRVAIELSREIGHPVQVVDEQDGVEIVDGRGEPFPKPGRRDGKDPCGECHLKPGETCDICGAAMTASQ